jgi:hypothetical protein
LSFVETFPLVLLGVVAILTPLLALGVTASKLHPHERTGLAVVYAGAVFLVGLIALDMNGALPDRLPVDLALLAGGLSLGIYAALVLGPRWSSWRRHGK